MHDRYRLRDHLGQSTATGASSMTDVPQLAGNWKRTSCYSSRGEASRPFPLPTTDPHRPSLSVRSQPWVSSKPSQSEPSLRQAASPCCSSPEFPRPNPTLSRSAAHLWWSKRALIAVGTPITERPRTDPSEP